MDITVLLEKSADYAGWAQAVGTFAALVVALTQPGRLLAKQQLQDAVGARNLAWMAARVMLAKAKDRTRPVTKHEIEACTRALRSIPIERVTGIAEPVIEIEHMWCVMTRSYRPSYLEIERRVGRAMRDIDGFIRARGARIENSGHQLASVPDFANIGRWHAGYFRRR